MAKDIPGTGRSPTVSVVILTYGNYGALERTVESVLGQTCPVQTIVLSDDASGVPFPQKVTARLETCGTQCVIRTSNRNMGTTAHMNQTAALCRSDYIKFIAAGDVFSDEMALSALVAFARETGAPVVTSNAVVVSEDLKYQYYHFPGSRRGALLNVPGEQLYRTLACANIVSAAGTLFRADYFGAYGGLNEEYRLLDDWPAWLRLAREGQTIPYLDRVTCCYAVGGLSSESGNAFASDKLRTDMLHCYEKEILPYLDRLTESEQAAVRYHYDVLSRKGAAYLWKNWFPAQVKAVGKATLKRILFRLGRRKNEYTPLEVPRQSEGE